jgi:hypothetical protein
LFSDQIGGVGGDEQQQQQIYSGLIIGWLI